MPGELRPDLHGPDQYLPAPLAGILDGIAGGRFPAADGGVTVVPAPSARDAGVLGLTGHAVVFADVDPRWVMDQLPPDDLGAPLCPPFLAALSGKLGRTAGSIDVLLITSPLPGPPALALEPWTDPDHPRIARALRHRDEVTAWRADGGVLLLGRGVAGRWETAIEVDPDRRGAGLGRALAACARHLVPGDGPLWAQVAPANAASVRPFLSAGYKPVGAEILLAAAAR